ncbi:hypothetical protein FH609_025090 [Streptomyces sp. 3MP-14]|uniref:Uncharacterized protein n=1 Tax=Streptomyces mimosae TaxID=2586635 RepID=A0A5N6A1D1_9ACTN|nr:MULTISPECIES: hypothetical protein [Streptomyces]KAB8161903.1 hypothetical protein FH607_022740 [Streptomyces mimosae]KAB8173601.1 hypothetical protein FH609_025090 [Streptomyces sp. 3MP-14]
MPEPLFLGGVSHDVPVFLVNPSFEVALLRYRAEGGWLESTVEPFAELGFGLRFGSEAAGWPPRIRRGYAEIDWRLISVTIPVGRNEYRWHDVPISPPAEALVRDLRWVLVVVTSLDPHRFRLGDLLNHMLGGRAAMGRAPLAVRRAPRFEGKTRATPRQKDRRRR